VDPGSPDTFTPLTIHRIPRELNMVVQESLRNDCVEKLFFAKNISSAMGVSEVRGIVLLAAEQRAIPVTEYTPNQVKQAITGSGRADKRQMQEMIKRLLRLKEIPHPDDAADALSIALCHIHILR